MNLHRLTASGANPRGFLPASKSKTPRSRISPSLSIVRETFPVDVSVVGCPSDGQQGPLPMPKVKSVKMSLPAGVAQRLAYYKSGAGRDGVLAPRGWHCFGTYGSSGNALYVAPEAFRTDNIFSDGWKGFTGPASEFPSGPFPSDSLRYLNNREVEFRTSPNSPGLGTRGKIRKNADPIEGAVMLAGEDTDVWQLSLRLPHGAEDLAPLITQQFEHAVSAVKR